MSLQLVRRFQKRLEEAVQFGGTRNETSVRGAFQGLLTEWAEAQSDPLRLVPEVGYRPPGQKNTVYPDGTLKDALQQPRGFWESKDEADTLDAEIEKKFAKGYPKDNILFEDSRTAVLIQHGEEVRRVPMDDAEALAGLLTTFFAFEPPQVSEFRRAIEQFRAEMPHLLGVLREAIAAAGDNPDYVRELGAFVELGREAIDPEFRPRDAGEMLIQHILTGDLFRSVFDNAQYHEDNNIAQQLGRLADTFYTGQVRRDVTGRTRRYYGAINAAAAQIADHHEKQKFLKVLYENFYRAYNPAGADRLGIFYTPGEIVRFMIEATDALLERHFGKALADPGVEILDPATGTGTFITELIDYLPLGKLAHKYAHDLHCNELALLPYYIANLNIEATYAQKTGHYAEFRNIVLVDTLDNTGFGVASAQASLFGSVSAENLERVKRQNARPLRVIIGNPPYRANQANENDNNKNREYKEIDRRIKETYVAASRAQKTKLYDMYSRFLRWATDRLKDDGIVAFVMNRSFIDSRTFDGFRKVAADEYTHIYVIDLGGDVRSNPRLSGPKHNVFAIQTGIAIAFLVKATPTKQRRAEARAQPAVIEYARRPEMDTAREKLAWLASTPFGDVDFERIRPDAKHNWIGQAEHGWEEFLPVADRDTKAAKSLGQERAIFKLYSLGIATNRDEWVYSSNYDDASGKASLFVETFNSEKTRWLKTGEQEPSSFVDRKIKWTSELENHLKRGTQLIFSERKLILSAYRPFVIQHTYYDKLIVHRLYQQDDIFPVAGPHENTVIAVNVSESPFNALASKYLVDLHFNGDSQCLPLYRYSGGERVPNITDFALKAFQTHYADASISREDIFHYVYAVLHHPAYREKYALNLRQEFPRVPFYPDFGRWAGWGRELMALHVDFETADPYPLERVEVPPKGDTPEARALAARARLKVVRDAAKVPTGAIELDGLTTLRGVPPQAWSYRLGNRSALEWVLERHKETAPKDPTIREKFNTYRFADHKERVVDLLARVTTVSVETARILGEMPGETV
ncbi:N-6 DNA Methylase [Deinococcus reticulitermitis]|uniref:site-specific DNA-methyltransferase (adenine-specific) n=1 Tax=Deinococcus reticulitermitis TaxID=856736 RepID=A0A1H6YFI6_9DEIO|nr:type ISP restriction/modification enzyme [Deinococcus reticulitermitis]SEJ39236.1 N-6 DNA Methylase [Deinococcus reticulitermitis]